MKHFSIIVFLLSTFTCFSQIQIIDSIPGEGVLLNKGWKFQRGDNPDYATPGYDDSKWQSIDPTLDIHDLPQIKEGIVWFRLHLFVDSNLLREQLALVIQQSGASEIYLNGSLIYSFGVFDTDAAKVKAYDPLAQPVVFPVKKDGQQILAIRYILQPGVRYTAIFASHNYAFKAITNTIEATNQQITFFFQDLFIAGIFFILTVLHLSFFLFYRSQKANLYFCLYTLFTMVYFIKGYFYSYIRWVEYKYYAFNLTVDLTIIGYVFMVTAIYYFLEQKRSIWYFTLMIFDILCIIAVALPGYWGWNIVMVLLTNLINLEITRISFIAVKKKKRGAWIMATGCLCYLVIWGVFIFAEHPGQISTFNLITFYTAFLCIPVSASVYLGVDFAFTNRLLQQKLIEVENLSQRTIAQEKEKQQILADQNETLEKQVTERTLELKQSLENLKSTQAQLIQSEKMASLGELTAGIAHEIQNPLNFVNNFSEVNKELLTEMNDELDKGNLFEAKAISKDLIDNEEKIIHHGKRADAIVKGMLQHSRISTGQKEPTDINKLADEYLRLSYHGMRAKDKSFNATTKTEFDESIGKIKAVPQDIGRVLLNLFNNAFYAVMQKKKGVGDSYEPTVSVITKKVDSKVEIHVKDNGVGIPQKVVEKIFQPFFTTKPTGQGTGLGLSLSYDIIKAHGGEIRVETKDGEGSEFIIQLPIS
jgi:two-component system NtrC family sensor kinase